jgi:hypothetical protein
MMLSFGLCMVDKARLLEGVTMLDPKSHQPVVFLDVFVCGLQMPPMRILREVLLAFKVQWHHLSPCRCLMTDNSSRGYPGRLFEGPVNLGTQR